MHILITAFCSVLNTDIIPACVCTWTSAGSKQKNLRGRQFTRTFRGQSIYMKSLMLRSSRAFLGGGGFFGLWAAPGDICTLTFVSVVSKKKR